MRLVFQQTSRYNWQPIICAWLNAYALIVLYTTCG